MDVDDASEEEEVNKVAEKPEEDDRAKLGAYLLLITDNLFTTLSQHTCPRNGPHPSTYFLSKHHELSTRMAVVAIYLSVQLAGAKVEIVVMSAVFLIRAMPTQQETSYGMQGVAGVPKQLRLQLPLGILK